MSRALPIWSVCLFSIVGILPAGAQGLRLEDYVPADFHRHYLSVGPSLFWTRDLNRLETSVFLDRRYRAEPFAVLTLNQGSEFFSQDRRWSLSGGATFNPHSSTSEMGNRNLSAPPTETSYHWTDESGGFSYNGFARLSGRQYLRGRSWLEPRLDADIDAQPSQKVRSQAWQSYQGVTIADSVPFYTNRNNSDQTYLHASGRAQVAVGFGRIQDVTFAETGLFLLDRMADVSGKPVPTDAQGMRELEAYVEARRKQRRFLDGRHAAVYDMESVCGFMRERGGMAELTSLAVLAMADEWNHAGRHKRESGWEVEVFPFASWMWQSSEADGNSRASNILVPAGASVNADSLIKVAEARPTSLQIGYDNVRFQGDTRIGGGARIRYERPWRRFFQLHAEGHGRISRVGMESGLEESADTAAGASGNKDRYIQYAYPSLEAGCEAMGHWYPNSRTDLATGITANWWRNLDYLDPKADVAGALGYSPKMRAQGFNQGFILGGDYWLSDRLTAAGTVRAGVEWVSSRDLMVASPWDVGGRIGKEETLHPYLNVNGSLTYYLF